MIYWDSSAIVPLLIREKSTRGMQALLEEDPEMLVWWGTRVECASALARLQRESSRSTGNVHQAFERLSRAAEGWSEIAPCRAVRDLAERMLRVHPLRAADALQLAAAIVGSEGRPSSLRFKTLDEKLEDAARREGLSVL